MNKEILLNPERIYNGEFKVDARGYRPQDVDKFLDMIIRDYEEYSQIIKELEEALLRNQAELMNYKRRKEEEGRKKGRFKYDARQNPHLFAHPRSISIIKVFLKNASSEIIGV